MSCNLSSAKTDPLTQLPSPRFSANDTILLYLLATLAFVCLNLKFNFIGPGRGFQFDVTTLKTKRVGQ